MSIFTQLKNLSHDRYVRLGLVVFVIIITIKLTTADNDVTIEPTTNHPTVSLTTAAAYTGNQSLSLIGNVRSFAEANVTAEQAGQVVSVQVKLGQTVRAGQIIAVLENTSERAAVLQAEGVYDAAVAASVRSDVTSAQDEVSIDEAETVLATARNNAVSVFQSSYNSTNGIVLNSLDAFFANPNKSIPGLRIDGKGYTDVLNAERVNFRTLLPAWQAKATTISPTSDLEQELVYAKQNVQRTIALVDTFITVFNRQDNSSRYNEAELQGFITEFTSLRANLITLQANINNSVTSLRSASDTVRRSKLTTSDSTTLTADAGIKQALGALHAAQARLSKTILTTPISGTVNSLNVRTGDFISAFSSLAKVANNNALEVVTFISESERTLFTIGDPVMIEDEFVGRVTEIAPAVDLTTRKIEVHIATDELGVTNGDTVRITKQANTENITSQAILIPLTAVKFEAENGYVFLVEKDQLVAQEVTLGTVRSGAVEIISGLDPRAEFVADARGLLAGTNVTINN